MAERNESSVVFQHSFCQRRIRERLDLVADLPSVLVRPWDSFAVKTIEKWQANKGLMFYRHMVKMDLVPETDALLFTCCPLHEKELAQFAGRVRNEIINHRPPDWSMHDETIAFKYPSGETYRKIIGALSVLKDAVLTRNQRLAVKYSYLPENKVSAFSEHEMHEVAGIPAGQFHRAIQGKWFMQGHYHRYEVYQPMVAPMEADLLEMYRLLEAEPDAGGGLRMLRMGKLKQGYIKFFEKALGILVKTKCVMQYEPVHIVLEGFKPMDYEMQDAVSAVKRAGCMRLRSMVDAAPIYGG